MDRLLPGSQRLMILQAGETLGSSFPQRAGNCHRTMVVLRGVPRDFALLAGVSSIGSDAHCDLQLHGLAPHHAEIRRDDADEYVFFATSPHSVSTVNGALVGPGSDSVAYR